MKRRLHAGHAICIFLAGLFFLPFSNLRAQPDDEWVPVDHRLQILPHCYVKKIPIVVVAYLPYVTDDEVDYIDHTITGVDPNNPNILLSNMKKHLLRSTIQAKYMLEEGSRFHGYKDPHASSYAGYEVIEYIYIYDEFELGKEVWWNPGVYRPDYIEVMNRIDGEHLVNDLGVKEIWLWGWHFGLIEPAESNMSSPLTGDISNSERYNDDLPIYDHTYILYNYNFDRTANEAVHNHGHQIEAQLNYINGRQDGNDALFMEKFVGWGPPAPWPEPRNPPLGRAGDTHHPPNTQNDYDYVNTENHEWSDIEDWKPEGGTEKLINADTWFDLNYDWPDNYASPGVYEPHWYMYWWQNTPGNANSIPYGENFITNWWKIIYEWDETYDNNLGLYASTENTSEACNFTRYATWHTTASWSDINAWRFLERPDPTKLEGNVEIYGYLTLGENLEFKNASGADTLFVYDTLVIEGQLNFRQNNTVKIGPDGVLVVLNGMSLDKTANVVNEGIFVVKGNIETAKDSEIILQQRIRRDKGGNVLEFQDEPYALDEDNPLGPPIPYQPRFFHVPDGGNLLDLSFLTYRPFVIQYGVEDSAYMKDPQPYPLDPDSEMISWIWQLLQEDPLPIDLMNFEATADGSRVLLDWQTASESNNDYFTLERSYNGLNFTVIGKIAGAGTTSEPSTYRFSDENPVPGIIYYRLTQTDFDGVSETFKVVSVMLDPAMQKLTIYPNPITDKSVLLRVNGFRAGKEALLLVSDLNGKMVHSESLSIPREGSCTFIMDFTQKMDRGTYIIQVWQGANNLRAKLVKI